LKPENLLLDISGYVKLVNFEFAKVIATDQRTYTLCGTPVYLAPEVVTGMGHSTPVDLWALGVFIYELLSGVTPFDNDDSMTTFTMIMKGVITFPTCINQPAAALIEGLCEWAVLEIVMIPILHRSKSPYKRLGAKDMDDIRKTTWFENFNFAALRDRKMQPPLNVNNVSKN
jgi:cGMP-dependent protein kinase